MAGGEIGKPKLYRGTACDQCFRLKTRCKGERPNCGHCQKRKATCTYSTGRVKRAKTTQEKVPTNEESGGDSPDSASSRWPPEQDDPGLSNVHQSILWNDQLPLLHSTADDIAVHNHQDLSDLGMDLQWSKGSNDSTNEVMEFQPAARLSTIEALGESKFHGNILDSNSIRGIDTSPSMRHEGLPRVNVASCNSGYDMAFENPCEVEGLAQPMIEGMFGSMPGTEIPPSSMTSMSMVDSRLLLDTVTPNQTQGIDRSTSDLRSSDVVRGLFDNEVKSPPQSISSRLQFARRSLDHVSTSIECHCAVVDQQSMFMALASIATLQLVLTSYQNIRLELAQPESSLVVNDFHIGAFQLEEGDMCNRVIEAIVRKELESCRHTTGRLRSWLEDSLGEEPKENTDILSAFLYGVEVDLKSFSSGSGLKMCSKL